MFLVDPLQSDVQQQLSTKVNLLSKVVWPALATLVPAAVTAIFKVLQDHSRKRLSAQLTDRIFTLAKSVAEFPDLPAAGTEAAVAPRSALTAELNAAVNELTALQTRPSHRFTGISATTRLRAALLLYRPKGPLAVTLHTLFYFYSFGLLFCLAAVMADQSSPFISTASVGAFFSDLLGFIIVFGILGIPPLLIRHYAAKIHHRQCLETQPTAPQAAPPRVVVPASPSNQEL